MASKIRKHKMKEPRELVTLGMILNCKGGPMKDRRAPRGGARNHKREFQAEADLG
jgi:hypothetical protein